jgi:RimJ/RimL family protein N-acetyltransferase
MDHNYHVQNGDLSLRPLAEQDLELVRQWRNTDSIKKCFIYQEEITQEEQLKWYNKYLAADDDIMFVVEWKNKPVGAVSLYHIDRSIHYAEFGRLMVGAMEVRGLGIGKKASKAVCDFGFNVLGLKQIYLEVFADNPHAYKIYEDLGFVTT